MHPAFHHRLPSRLAARLLLLLALATTLFALTHCRQVGDRLSGVNVPVLGRSSIENCLEDCREDRDEDLKRENRRHRRRERDCGNDQACLDREAARHAARVAIIEARFTQCLSGCHKQGGGGDH